MNWTETLSKMLERMETRKRNTDKAREELEKIMDLLSEKIEPSVRIFSKKDFWAKAIWYESGLHFRTAKGWFRFMSDGGLVKIATFEDVFDEDGFKIRRDFMSHDYGPTATFHSGNLGCFRYIDFEALVPSLIQFIDKLSNVTTLDEEVKTFKLIKEALDKKAG